MMPFVTYSGCYQLLKGLEELFRCNSLCLAS